MKPPVQGEGRRERSSRGARPADVPVGPADVTAPWRRAMPARASARGREQRRESAATERLSPSPRTMKPRSRPLRLAPAKTPLASAVASGPPAKTRRPGRACWQDAATPRAAPLLQLKRERPSQSGLASIIRLATAAPSEARTSSTTTASTLPARGSRHGRGY